MSGKVAVLIVGAGPVGLSLALDLGRRGIRSLLIERNSGTGTELLAKADYLNERSMEFFRKLDLAKTIADTGFPDDVSRDTVFCTSLNGYLIGRDAMPSMRDRKLPVGCVEMHRRCPQFWLDPLLARTVVDRGMSEIRYNTAFESLAQDSNGVTCIVRDTNTGQTEEIEAHYAVACDGLTSSVRKQLGIPFEGEQLDYSVSVVVDAPDLPSKHPFGMAERYLFIGPEGTWANLTSMDGRSLYRFTVVGSEERLDPIHLDMPALLARAFGRSDIEYKLMPATPWRRTHFVAERFAEGRVFLAGDSAHTMSPTGGHGLNTGLGDVMDLGWILQALLGGWGGPVLKDAYTAERQPIAQRNGESSSKNYGIWVDREGREHVLESGAEADAQREALGRKIATALKQEFHSLGIAMGYSYAESPIVISDGTPAPEDHPSVYVQTARPGHRAPNFVMDNGEAIIDHFGDGFVLLRFGEHAPDPKEIGDAAECAGMPLRCMTIADRAAYALYERKLVLVRPDGMVAWRSDTIPENPKALIDRVRGAGMTAAQPVQAKLGQSIFSA